MREREREVERNAELHHADRIRFSSERPCDHRYRSFTFAYDHLLDGNNFSKNKGKNSPFLLNPLLFISGNNLLIISRPILFSISLESLAKEIYYISNFARQDEF